MLLNYSQQTELPLAVLDGVPFTPVSTLAFYDDWEQPTRIGGLHFFSSIEQIKEMIRDVDTRGGKVYIYKLFYIPEDTRFGNGGRFNLRHAKKVKFC